MKTRTKIVIDRFVGTPLVYLVNVLARLLGFILRIDHGLDKPFKTIVVCKYVGLGSIIQSTPLLQRLRHKFPDARIIYITTKGGAQLLNHIPEVNEVMAVSDKNFREVIVTSLKLLFRLWKIKPDLFIDLEFYSNYSSIMTALSKAKNRLGFYKEDLSYRKGVYNYLVNFNVDVPISQTYLQFAGLVNCPEIPTEVRIDPKTELYLTSALQKTGISAGKNYMVVNPNASDLRLERRWAKHSYVKTINTILNNYPSFYMVLIGDKSEVEYVTDLEKELNHRERVINTAGKLTLSELISVIATANLMLTNDTGPMHIAFATKTRTISLFGPCSPHQYGGLGNGVTFYEKVHCSPCVHKYILPPCHGDNQCMKRIKEENVIAALSKELVNLELKP